MYQEQGLIKSIEGFGIKAQENRKIIIVGAGNIGLNTIKIIETDYPEITCKIIDNNLERTKLIQLNYQPKYNTLRGCP